MHDNYRPKFVDKGNTAHQRCPEAPQWWLANTHHPYAPFPGNAVNWESHVYDDGTTYEGLMLESIPHNKGIIIFGLSSGGGIQRPERADRYEGEFDSGFAHGLGQYTAATDGKVYRGEYYAGLRHGCGVEYRMKPFLDRLKKGMDPDEAWKKSVHEIMRKAKMGTWYADEFITGPDRSGRWCHLDEIRGTEEEVGEVVAKTRMFEFKPDGEVTFRFLQDGNGLPAPVMQDPLHYPHGTKFLAPGPMGQCFPVPNDPNLRRTMALSAEMHRKIYRMYNFPYKAKPGSLMDKAEKLWKKENGDRDFPFVPVMDKKPKRAEKKMRRNERPAKGKDKIGRRQPVREVPQDDIDLDLLVASEVDTGQQQREEGGPDSRHPSAFASMALGLSQATVMLQRAFHKAAVRPPERRCIM